MSMEDFRRETGLEPPEHIGLLFIAAVFFIFIAIGLPIVSRSSGDYDTLEVIGVIAIAVVLTYLITYAALKIQNKNPKYMEAKEKYLKVYREYEEELKRKTKEAKDSNNTSKYDELRELSKLKDEGFITIEEFDTKRKQMLGL